MKNIPALTTRWLAVVPFLLMNILFAVGCGEYSAAKHRVEVTTGAVHSKKFSIAGGRAQRPNPGRRSRRKSLFRIWNGDREQSSSRTKSSTPEKRLTPISIAE